MAATRQLAGTLREVWLETVPQGPGTETVTTGIRVSQAQLSRVQAFAIVYPQAGAPSYSTGLGVSAGGFLTISLTNMGAPGSTAVWILDITLNHTLQQSNSSTAAPVIVINGNLNAVGAPQNLAQTYAIGTLAAHQTLVMDAAHGGGVLFDARGMTVPGPSLEVRVGDTYQVVELSRYVAGGGMSPNLGVALNFAHARGTFAAPTDLLVNDLIGTVNFSGYLNGGLASGGEISCAVTSVAANQLSTSIEIFTARTGASTLALTIDAEANARIAGISGSAATQALVLPGANTVFPTIAGVPAHGPVGAVFLQGHPQSATPGDKTILSLVQEENFQGVSGLTPNQGIPILYNGQYCLLFAYFPPS